MNPETVAEIIDIPVSDWPGKCYEIAELMVSYEIVQGDPTYGDWHGPVAPGTIFEEYRATGVFTHGWIIRPDGLIVDPTRWVFEGAEPYIYVGPSHGFYDEGGQACHRMRMPPPPPFDESEDLLVLKVPIETEEFLRELKIEARRTTVHQVFWLANYPVSKLGIHAKPIFEALCQVDGYAEMIPLDSRRMVERLYGKLVVPEK